MADQKFLLEAGISTDNIDDLGPTVLSRFGADQVTGTAEGFQGCHLGRWGKPPKS